MPPQTAQRLAYVICFVVISTATIGYFVGLQSPMGVTADPSLPSGDSAAPNRTNTQTDEVMSSTHYSELSAFRQAQRDMARPTLAALRKIEMDPDQLITITPQQKQTALAIRESNRSFNGAPPTVPHPIEQMKTETCAACHTDGARTMTFRIPQMSHVFMENCTQCHVEATPQHMDSLVFADNDFRGLPAPQGGPRAFQTAPPQIPHSTWMRSNCNSCHGPTGNYGIRTTHPWRQNCQQCHTPSSTLEQIQINETPGFLPPPRVEPPTDNSQTSN